MLIFYFIRFPTLKVEELRSYETSLNFTGLNCVVFQKLELSTIWFELRNIGALYSTTHEVTYIQCDN
jgi:hypothetical protein